MKHLSHVCQSQWKMTRYRMLLLFFAFCHVSFCHADPWGKDADLCNRSTITSCCPKDRRTPFIGTIGEALIRFHQEVISPADGPRSHFIPSSSQYTIDAMRQYGFFTGFTMGCDRLMRENSDPWVYKITYGPAGPMKSDPVR